MKKNITFAGLGIVLAALVIFMLRLINAAFFQNNLNMLIVVGVLGIAALIVGMIKRMNKATMFFSLGVIVTAVLEFLVRMIFTDNVSLFVIFLVVGLATLIFGLLKGR